MSREIESMRALTWKQPYAGLMLEGKIETRTWATKYRGWVLICAGKQPYSNYDLFKIAGPEQLERISKFLNTSRAGYVKGKAIAIGKLVDCREMTPQDEDACYVKFRPGLYCHVYEDVTPISQFNWYGKQGWSQVPEHLIKLILDTPASL